MPTKAPATGRPSLIPTPASAQAIASARAAHEASTERLRLALVQARREGASWRTLGTISGIHFTTVRKWVLDTTPDLANGKAGKAR
jgi:hypothetical protein